MRLLPLISRRELRLRGVGSREPEELLEWAPCLGPWHLVPLRSGRCPLGSSHRQPGLP